MISSNPITELLRRVVIVFLSGMKLANHFRPLASDTVRVLGKVRKQVFKRDSLGPQITGTLGIFFVRTLAALFFVWFARRHFLFSIGLGGRGPAPAASLDPDSWGRHGRFRDYNLGFVNHAVDRGRKSRRTSRLLREVLTKVGNVVLHLEHNLPPFWVNQIR
jgi:hypothetical protein